VAAAVRLPAVFSEYMVLQRGQPVPIWGWAENGEEIVLNLNAQTRTTKAGPDGRWKVVFAKLDVGQPLQLTVKGSSGNSIVVPNILVGDVWLCSGQSNMQWTFNAGQGVLNNDAEVAAAKYPGIRVFTVGQQRSPQPAVNINGVWLPVTPENLRADGKHGTSAVAYFFGRELHRELGIPIGLIVSSVGGTSAELWTSRKALETNPRLKSLATQGDTSVLYNGMIAPLVPYAIRGVIWYQGEDNVARAYQYRELFPTLIAQWRNDWGQGVFPFGFVQLAPCRYQPLDPMCCAELREAQAMTAASTPNTGMAVTMDIGEVTCIHPKNKQEVGRRLALWALAQVYGRSIVYSGPIYKAMTVEGNRIRIAFQHVGGGLVALDGKPLTGFAIAGADRKFLPAFVEIESGSILVHSDQVAAPMAVRYAWRDDATPNLANKEGLPASPFRTDVWKGVTEP
jgi:sialate O-acetylesterase